MYGRFEKHPAEVLHPADDGLEDPVEWAKQILYRSVCHPTPASELVVVQLEP